MGKSFFPLKRCMMHYISDVVGAYCVQIDDSVSVLSCICFVLFIVLFHFPYDFDVPCSYYHISTF